MAAAARKLVPSPDVSGVDLRIAADRVPLEPQILLTSGGDGRIAVEDGGVNRYGCGPIPAPAVAPFGSSTASVVSPSAYAAVSRLTERLRERTVSESRAAVYRQELDRIRGKIACLLGVVDVAGLKTILSPSGTDLHRVALHLTAAGAAAPPLVILSEPYETGSGVVAALGGRVGPSAALRATIGARNIGEALLRPEIMTAPSRRADGTLRPAHHVDEDVAVIATAAARMGRRVLLVMLDVSKTGLISPSVACAQDLKQRFPEQIEVLVDACQLRLAPQTLAAYLRQDFLVAVTGSKFMTGPAFSGALFVPPGAADRLQRGTLATELARHCLTGEFPQGWAGLPPLAEYSNFGLAARWEAAIEEMKRFFTLPPAAVAGFFADFGTAVAERLCEEDAFEPIAVRPLERTGLGAHLAWDREQTIFPFLLKSHGKPMSPVETLSAHRLMTVDLGGRSGWSQAGRRGQLGQPVNCGERQGDTLSALRLCASARLAVDALAPGGRGAAAVIGDAMDVLDKAAWLTTRICER